MVSHDDLIINCAKKIGSTQRVVRLCEDRICSAVKVKLRLLDHETLEKASRRLRSSEGPETSAGAPLCYSERIFMKKHSNEINQL